ncbi:MAG: hypothetical protein ABSC94_29400 [Polyangiaceae bacterium]
MAGAKDTILKARLSRQPSHPRALPTLLEAMALWQGSQVRAALCAAERDGESDSSLYRDVTLDFGGPLYTVEWLPAAALVRRRPEDIDGMGAFADLRERKSRCTERTSAAPRVASCDCSISTALPTSNSPWPRLIVAAPSPPSPSLTSSTNDGELPKHPSPFPSSYRTTRVCATCASRPDRSRTTTISLVPRTGGQSHE